MSAVCGEGARSLNGKKRLAGAGEPEDYDSALTVEQTQSRKPSLRELDPAVCGQRDAFASIPHSTEKRRGKRRRRPEPAVHHRHLIRGDRRAHAAKIQDRVIAPSIIPVEVIARKHHLGRPSSPKAVGVVEVRCRDSVAILDPPTPTLDLNPATLAPITRIPRFA